MDFPVTRFRIVIQARRSGPSSRTSSSNTIKFKDTLDDLDEDAIKIARNYLLDGVDERLHRNSLEQLTRSIRNDVEDNSHKYYQLGYYYHYGIGPVQKDEHKAMENYRLAIEDHHPGAYYQLAQLVQDRYGNYNDVDIDQLTLIESIEEQVKMLTKSAAEGKYTQSYRKLKDSYADSQNWRSVIDDYYQSLEKSVDTTENTNQLSHIYNELGILDVITAECNHEKEKSDRQLQRGYDYFEKSKQLGKPAASYNLAVHKFAGLSSPRPAPTTHDSENIQYYIMAADQGHCLAQFELAILYQTETPTTNRDYSEALKLLLKSARYGYSDILYHVGLAYLNGLGVAQDLNLAKDYFEWAIAATNLFDNLHEGRQYFQLGYIYHKGLGLSIDIEQATHFYASGILMANCLQCYLFLAKLIEKKKLQNLNISSAIKLYMKIIELDNNNNINGYAHYRLGKIYSNDRYCNYYDSRLSKIHYEYALDRFRSKRKEKIDQDSDDYYHVGRIYQFGLGVRKDLDAAVINYQKAIGTAEITSSVYDKHYAQKALKQRKSLLTLLE
ncbi:Death ligand signal enhancer [Trichoplax sp. H2]|nr:Death ligand signal enhancer [Trichoplax sp. H2]|eukprot:RDD38263.1 Death ligand signal enhancer [Trichoplax sp. H2]